MRYHHFKYRHWIRKNRTGQCLTRQIFVWLLTNKKLWQFYQKHLLLFSSDSGVDESNRDLLYNLLRAHDDSWQDQDASLNVAMAEQSADISRQVKQLKNSPKRVNHRGIISFLLAKYWSVQLYCTLIEYTMMMMMMIPKGEVKMSTRSIMSEHNTTKETCKHKHVTQLIMLIDLKLVSISHESPGVITFLFGICSFWLNAWINTVSYKEHN